MTPLAWKFIMENSTFWDQLLSNACIFFLKSEMLQIYSLFDAPSAISTRVMVSNEIPSDLKFTCTRILFHIDMYKVVVVAYDSYTCKLGSYSIMGRRIIAIHIE